MSLFRQKPKIYLTKFLSVRLDIVPRPKMLGCIGSTDTIHRRLSTRQPPKDYRKYCCQQAEPANVVGAGGAGFRVGSPARCATGGPPRRPPRDDRSPVAPAIIDSRLFLDCQGGQCAAPLRYHESSWHAS